MNAVLHEVAAEVYGYWKARPSEQRQLLSRKKYVSKTSAGRLFAEFLIAINVRLGEVVGLYQPSETLIIAVDGPVPMAKMVQQRQRRYRKVATGDPLFDLKFDSNGLTPGTDMMFRIDQSIRNWMVDNRDSLPPVVIYSSHMAPGEGEHKIMDYFREAKYISNPGAHVIVGGDSDLVMLSLISNIHQIWVSRENNAQHIRITQLRRAISDAMGTKNLNEFIVMSFLVGNDFIPPIASLGDLEYYFEAVFKMYQAVKGKGPSFLTRIEGGRVQIHWDNFQKLLRVYEQNEQQLLEAKAAIEVKHPSILFEYAKEEDGTLNLDTYRTLWYSRMFLPYNPTLDYGSGYTLKSSEIRRSAFLYLESLAWVLDYYLIGVEAVNLDFYYPFYFAPMIKDLRTVSTNTAMDLKHRYERPPDQVFVNAIHQLLIVLPPQSRELVPKPVQHLTMPDSPIGDYFPYLVRVIKDGINEDYLGVVVMPPVELSRVVAAVDDTSVFTVCEADKYSSVGDLIYEDAERRKQAKQVTARVAKELDVKIERLVPRIAQETQILCPKIEPLPVEEEEVTEEEEEEELPAVEAPVGRKLPESAATRLKRNPYIKGLDKR